MNVAIKYSLIFLMLSAWQASWAQGHLFTETKVNKSSVYVGEPVEVTVSVFTSTWFTKGVDLQNIKVNGAFTVYFRSLSTSRQINGKTYAGVELFYNVFPYDDKDIVFPSLEITVETPDDGGYKGVTRVVKTNAKKIRVKPVPAGFSRSEWLVTSGLRVQESWSGDLTNVKVGDVLTRKISRNASGTVSELIPPINWDTIPGISLYPFRSDVENNKTKTAISASRSDVIRYLFEKEGEIIIPSKELTWWNPVQNKLYKRTLKQRKIQVAPNPDLGMLSSIQDSLSTSIQTDLSDDEEQAAFSVLGLNLKQLLMILGASFVAIVVFISAINRISEYLRKRREAYLQSELYYFDQFRKAAKNYSQTAVSALYQWIDHLNLEESTLKKLAEHCNSEAISDEIKRFEDHTRSEKNEPFKWNLRCWSEARHSYFSKEQIISKRDDWIN